MPPNVRNAAAGDRGARGFDRAEQADRPVNTPVASRSQRGNVVSVEVASWKPYERGTLLGFAEIVIPQLKLHIADITVHRHASGKMWCGMPGKPRLDRDGNVVRAENGKPEYSKVIWFDGREDADAFSAAVVAGVEEYCRSRPA